MADIRHTLSLDAGDLIRNAGSAADGLGDVQGAAGGADGGLKAMSKTTVALGASLAGLGAVLAKGITQAIKYGDALGKMSERTGRTVESLSALKRAAENSDTSLETVERAMSRLATVDPSLTLEAVADEFASMENGAAKAARASELFGERIGRELIPLLNLGSKGLKENADFSEDLALVWSDETSQAAEDLNDAIADLGRVAHGLVGTLAQQMLPTLADIAKGAVLAARAFLTLGRAQRDADAEARTAAQNAINAQSDQIAVLRQRLEAEDAAAAAAAQLTGFDVERTERGRELAAELERQVGVLRRLKGELGDEAGLLTDEARALRASSSAHVEHADAVERTTDRKEAAIVRARDAARRAFVEEANDRARADAQALREQDAREAESLAQAAAYHAERERLAEESARRQEDIERSLTSAILSITSSLVRGIGEALRDLNEARTKDAQERRDREVALAILMGEIQAGLAFASTLAQIGGTPAGYAAAAAAAAAVGVQTKISAGVGFARSKEAFHDGGLVGDEVQIRARVGEFIVPPQTVRANGGAEGVQQALTGGGQELTIVQKLDHKVLDAQIGRAIGRDGSPLSAALRATDPRGTGRRNPYQPRI